MRLEDDTPVYMIAEGVFADSNRVLAYDGSRTQERWTHNQPESPRHQAHETVMGSRSLLGLGAQKLRPVLRHLRPFHCGDYDLSI